MQKWSNFFPRPLIPMISCCSSLSPTFPCYSICMIISNSYIVPITIVGLSFLILKSNELWSVEKLTTLNDALKFIKALLRSEQVYFVWKVSRTDLDNWYNYLVNQAIKLVVMAVSMLGKTFKRIEEKKKKRERGNENYVLTKLWDSCLYHREPEIYKLQLVINKFCSEPQN